MAKLLSQFDLREAVVGAVSVSEGSLTHGDLWSGVNWINSG